MSLLSPNNSSFSIDELESTTAEYYYFEGSLLFHIEIQSWYELFFDIRLFIALREVRLLKLLKTLSSSDNWWDMLLKWLPC